ncbi:hypothetical protein QJS04_geneDACA007224 [Acorus gramineus]|uniref:Phylloplanin n=1 Tax=Acorus gramineus TaxID=55184 RepID=A0AAV9BRX2_ACOGR|nr:hypothetical protein QJS04_geneDACA007224 [Acorus gramineus]
MAAKSLLFVAAVLILVGSMETQMAKAQSGLLGGLLGLIRINGTVFCTTDSTTISTTPGFANAQVQLQCGNTVVTSTTTNGSGVFTILLNPLTTLLSSLLNNCNLVVNTPLATCNVGLPTTGILQSPLQLIGRTVSGLLGIVNLGATGFSFIPS